MANKNYCYIHVCNINNGLDILKELLDKIKSSTLDTVLEKIRISILGPISKSTLSNIEKYNSKVEIIYINDNIKLYEYPTLKLIHQFSIDNDDCNILYIHTKGASKPHIKGEVSWRHYMTYFTIEKYRECLRILKSGYDTVGCDLKTGSNKFKYLHYAGNFWWASSKYLGKKLPDPQQFVTQQHYYRESKIYRFYAEEWIMMSDNVKAYCFFYSNRDLIKYPIHSMEYKDGDIPYLNYLNNLKHLKIIDNSKYHHLSSKYLNQRNKSIRSKNENKKESNNNVGKSAN